MIFHLPLVVRDQVSRCNVAYSSIDINTNPERFPDPWDFMNVYTSGDFLLPGSK